jgi:NADH dehydrogenase FAD-containing subunit
VEEFNQVVGTGFGGITFAHNARPKEHVDNLLIDAVTTGRLYSNWWKKFLERLFRIPF